MGDADELHHQVADIDGFVQGRESEIRVQVRVLQAALDDFGRVGQGVDGQVFEGQQEG